MTTPPILSIKEPLRCHLVSRDPLIIISYGLPFGAPMQLSPLLKDRKAYFLMGNWWSLLDRTSLIQVKSLFGLMCNLYPRHEFLFLTNAPEESVMLGALDLPNYFCHHNTFLDERLFQPLPGVAKDLDAVYTARPQSFKRHSLARLIPSWALLYYFTPGDQEKQRAYVEHLRRAMPGMVLPNHDPQTDAYRRLSPAGMCRAINRAKVGLCLSSVEGGNYSVTEYMLCGLPVVTTPSQGGRDQYLDPAVTRTVPPDAQAVAEAVAELADRAIPPREVRLRALVKMREQRQRFIRLIDTIWRQEGREDSFADHFDAVFTHKMLTHPGSPEAFLAEHGLLSDMEPARLAV